MVKYLLFDFDGTLFDTGVGVMRCVQYALKKLGIEEHDEANLRKFIGPPLDEMFSELYGFSPETAREAGKPKQAEQACLPSELPSCTAALRHSLRRPCLWRTATAFWLTRCLPRR